MSYEENISASMVTRTAAAINSSHSKKRKAVEFIKVTKDSKKKVKLLLKKCSKAVEKKRSRGSLRRLRRGNRLTSRIGESRQLRKCLCQV